MKKKLSLKRLRRSDKSGQAPSRITNDTVAEHREKILAGGRRYKYPIQYAKHRLVINAIVITLATLVIMVAIGWWQLYLAQNTSTFMYRVTQLFSLPVAKVDKTFVSYSDYLLYYRPSEYYLEKFGDRRATAETNTAEQNHIKRAALDKAISVAYARQIMKERTITVTDTEVNQALESLRRASNGELSQDAINASAERNFGVTEADTFMQYKNSLSVSKAAFVIDDTARALKDRVVQKIKTTGNSDLEKIATEINVTQKDSVSYGVSGLVSIASVSSGVRVTDIAKNEKGKIAGPIQSLTDDGYFFVNVLEKNDTQVSYAFIHVPLKKLNQEIDKLRKSGKISEYIKLAEDTK